MSSEDTNKVCPNCKKTDTTSFSTCRYCGTRYNAIIPKQPVPGVDQKVLIGICVAALAVGGYFVINANVKEVKSKRLASIVADVRSSHRPRVIEFYADWCGPCRSYGPIIEECRAKYAGRVDFQRLNVDDPNSQSMARAVGVSAIPMTCMFDSQGNEVAEVVGGISAEELDDYMHKLLAAN